MQLGLGCCCGSCCGHGDRYDFSVNLGSVTEAPHDPFTSSGFNFTNTFHDQYPTAAEIGGSHTLRAISWVENDNRNCIWQKAVWATRWYKRTTTISPYPPFGFGDARISQTLDFVDIPWDAIGSQRTNPHSGCGTPNVQCGNAVWGFQLTLLINESVASVELYRSVARHIHSILPTGIRDPNQSRSDFYDFCDRNTRHDYVGTLVPTKSRPAVDGYMTCGTMYQPGNPLIARWSLADPCDLSFPWVLTKEYDVENDPAVDVPRTPNTIEVT
jgi:hypothetical protein